MNWVKQHKKKIIIVVLSLLALGLLVLVVRWYRNQLRKIYFPGSTSDGFQSPSPSTAANALSTVISRYGRDRAKTVEQIYDWETTHMTSGGYKNTNAPGMEDVRDSAGKPKPFPYGWTSLNQFWLSNPGYAPIGIWSHTDGTGKVKPFLIFPTTEAGMMTLAEWLETHRPGNWFSTDLSQQLDYENKIAGMVPMITNSLA